MSLTVSVNEQLAELPLPSLTEHPTDVVPFWNAAPDAGEHVTVPTPGQLSVAEGVA